MKTTFLLSQTAAGLILAAGLTLGSDPALACNGSSPIMGEVCPVAFNWCPTGTLPASGTLLQINQYEALFSLIGATFGGDGATTFALPNLNGNSVVSSNPSTQPSGLGKMSGSTTVALVPANLPAHTHTPTLTVDLTTTSGVSAKPARGNDTLPQAGDMLATANTQTGPSVNPVPSYIPAANAGTGVNLGGGTTFSFSGAGLTTVGFTGNTTSISTIPPQLALQYCISTVGMYPTKP